jgi:hypothetical protein
MEENAGMHNLNKCENEVKRKAEYYFAEVYKYDNTKKVEL